MYRFQIRRLAIFILAAIGLFGFNSTLGQLYRNGCVQHILTVMATPQPTLPGSQAPLVTRYLGLPVVDKLLTIGAVLWAHVTDGSAPALSLYAVQFGGQLVPVFLIMIIEASRRGNTHNPLFFSVLWGYAMQIFGYATVMPLYCTAHLCISLTAVTNTRQPFPQTTKPRQALAEAILPRNPASLTLDVLIPAFSLGYFVPSLLMSWPVSSSTLHQWLGAVWQGFPLLVVLFQHLFLRFTRPSSEHPAEILSRAYNWTFNVAITTQFFAYAVILLAKIYPKLFPDAISAAFTFTSVFMPGPFHSTTPMVSMATAAHNMFKWDQYVGSTAALLWGITLEAASRDMGPASWVLLGWEVLRWTALAGPAGAVVKLLQRRDREILRGQAPVESKAK